MVASSARPRNAQITEGARAIAKKLGQARTGGYTSEFDRVQPTQENAEALIRDILTHPHRTVVGKVTVDAYNAAGQGVRFRGDTFLFEGFLEAARATR